ncbi:hypothetical protein E2562_019909 [Oryza meyeriana var. granulata]|uniref:NB-ARC domain-containing protein n=1 Tax=Oryza meyeriana var. granulata TaxID=110450 RepID=A0A6G1EXG0_9ORYZ|nr:hypothetical protein E2562_019909 [Oryza meyeriana var. granulata]
MSRRPYDAYLYIDNFMFGRHTEKQRLLSFLLEYKPPGLHPAVLPVVGGLGVGKKTLVAHDDFTTLPDRCWWNSPLRLGRPRPHHFPPHHHRPFLRLVRALHPRCLLGLVQMQDQACDFVLAEPPHRSAPAASAVAQEADFAFFFLPESATPGGWLLGDFRDGLVSGPSDRVT